MRCECCGRDDGDEEQPDCERHDESVVKKFAKYYKANPAWGAFHVMLADGNFDCNCDADWCLSQNDKAAAKLAPLLSAMSQDQRWMLAIQVDEYLETKEKS